jgi:hypothetical protein
MNTESQQDEVRSTKLEVRRLKVRSQIAAETLDFVLRTSNFVLQTSLSLVCVLTLIWVAPVGAQGTKADTPPKATNKMITLSGCVERGETTPTQYTLVDAEEGTTYRLTGTDVRNYIGKKVQIVGAQPTGRLKIVGGLTPTPNIAAQAGAMDPARAATAAAGGSAGPGSVTLPEFKVKSVRPVSGSCGN